ncbi:MAG TPA: UDP-N-acetylglucosamine--N-acetylmuramyl-(pentapeptide) pyrophosphoryl-undecaprenol N-acetylglucosamine transferase [Acidimicrobiales bacterium]|nr:UDP-N-acetylglucosamine--N-acetylmuramyl-(pentapeptide) pyrophosphoryl-undecaprenol N-acetylglucosamine transferase [Acidimicrobiales bacterium]
MSPRRYALVAGGGTAGHAMPALAVARAIAQRRGAGSVELVGSRRGVEATLLPDEGLPYELLPGRGFSRRVNFSKLVDNLGALAGLASATLSALRIVANRRPAVVVAVGGYASVPVASAAVMFRIPLVLVNIDSVPGAANRLFQRFSRASTVAFANTQMARAVVTGAPVRSEVLSVDRSDPSSSSAARAALGVPPHVPLVAAFGGSLGAKQINEAVLALCELWSERSDRAIYHVVGRRDAGWAAAQARRMHDDRGPRNESVPGDEGAPGSESVWRDERSSSGHGLDGAVLFYKQVPYEAHMELVYQAADVAVCRAGAMTVAELAAAGLPSVLVPLPGAPGDHQLENAKTLAQEGAAIVLLDEECTGDRLASVLDELLADRATSEARLAKMASAASSLARPGAAQAIASVAELYARPRSAGPKIANANEVREAAR